jgi:hypothetical protein
LSFLSIIIHIFQQIEGYHAFPQVPKFLPRSLLG